MWRPRHGPGAARSPLLDLALPRRDTASSVTASKTTTRPSRSNLALGWIGEFYEIDGRAGSAVARRLELRRTESAAVLAKLKTWLWTQAVLKSLSIGKAAAYTIANWERLTRFVDSALRGRRDSLVDRRLAGMREWRAKC